MGSMTDTELAALLANQLSSSVSAYSDLEDDQADALDYYHGRPYGNEKEGQSQIVTREVLETVEWIKPSLMKVFASGQKVVVFDPEGPEDEPMAEQETDIINFILTKDNDWWGTVYDWIHDALVQKVGYVKVYWDVDTKVRSETYRGLTDEEFAQLLEEGEPVAHTETEVEGMILHDVTIERTEEKGRIRIDPIPAEEIKVSHNTRSVSLKDAEFVAHSREVTASYLLDRGIAKKVVDQLSSDIGDEELEVARNTYEDTIDEVIDDSLKRIRVDECFVLLDYDKTGTAKRRRVLMSGKTILENDEWEDVPIVALSPIPLPHKHVGLSEADLVMDIQLIKSTLVRQILDNLYRTNNPEKEVVWDNVLNADALMVSVPGGIKPVKQAGTINPLTVPFTAQHSMPMLDLLDGMKEVRTGISRHTQGLDADALAQSTKGAFMGALKQANQRLEMIARIFAETGFKELFRLVHKMFLQNQDKPRWLKLRNEWVEVDPSEWRERDDMTVVVGSGTHNDEELIGKLFQLAEKQEQHLLQGSPMVSAQNLYNTYEQIIEKAGLKDVSRYFVHPKDIQPKQPEPSESEKVIQAQFQIEGMKRQVEELKAQLKAQSDKFKFSLEKLKLDRDYELKSRDLERKEIESGYDMATDRTEQELKYMTNVPGSVV